MLHTDFLVVNKITDFVPSTSLNKENINIPHHTLLADPSYANPGKIDMILGVEHFFEIIKENKHRASGTMTFQDSVLLLVVLVRLKDQNNIVILSPRQKTLKIVLRNFGK